MVLETHNVTIKATLPLTFNRKTSHSAHALLEKIFTIECKKAQITNYGLTMKPGTQLKIANTEEAAFLLQAELNSIERGSKYVEDRQSVDRHG